MASLRDTLRNAKRIKLGGALAETSEEETQELARQAGTPLQSNPLEISVLGANADQTKMAGTPSQSNAALRFNIQGQSNLADAQRTAQPNKQASAEQQSAAERARSLGRLGDLQGRVQQLVDKRLAAAQPSTAGQPPELAATMPRVDQAKLFSEMEGYTTAQKRAASAALAKIAAGDKSPAQYTALANAFGISADDSAKLKELTTKFYQPVSDQVAQQMTAAIPKSLTLAEFAPEQLNALGFADAGELAEVLAVSPEQLRTMTIDDLKETVETERQLAYSNTDKLRSRASDPALSEAERQQAVQDLRAEGAVGTTATEQDMQKLVQDLESADQVEFNGMQFTTDEVLSDKFLTETIKSALDNPEALAQLKEKEPELAQFVESHRNALEAQLKNVRTGVEDFVKINQANAKLAKTKSGDLPDSIMETLYPDWGSTSTDALKPTGVLNVLNDTHIPAAYRNQLMTVLDNISGLDSRAARELAKMDYQQLVEAGLTDPNKLQDYLAGVRNQVLIRSVPADALLPQLFEGIDPKDLSAAVRDAHARQTLGTLRPNEVAPVLRILDADQDGRIDPPESVKAALSAALGSRKDVAKSSALFAKLGLDNPAKALANLQGEMAAKNDVITKFGPLVTDRSVSASDVKKIVSQGATMREVNDLLDSGYASYDSKGLQALRDGVVKRDITAPLNSLGIQYGPGKPLTEEENSVLVRNLQKMYQKYGNDRFYKEAIEKEADKILSSRPNWAMSHEDWEAARQALGITAFEAKHGGPSTDEQMIREQQKQRKARMMELLRGK